MINPLINEADIHEVIQLLIVGAHKSEMEVGHTLTHIRQVYNHRGRKYRAEIVVRREE